MRFIESGELERHVARMKKVYRGRRDYLIVGLHARFPGKVDILGEAAGMHVVADFAGTVFTPGLMEDLERAGLNVIPVEDHALVKGRNLSRIILGYAHLGFGEIDVGLGRLEKVLQTRTECKEPAEAGLRARR